MCHLEEEFIEPPGGEEAWELPRWVSPSSAPARPRSTAPDPANAVEQRLWKVFAENRTSSFDADPVNRDRDETIRTMETLMHGATKQEGPWCAVQVTLPPRMALVLAEWAEAIEATHSRARGAANPFRMTDAELDFWHDITACLHNAPPRVHKVTSTELHRFGMLMVRALQAPNFRRGDPRFIRATTSPLGIHPYAAHRGGRQCHPRVTPALSCPPFRAQACGARGARCRSELNSRRRYCDWPAGELDAASMSAATSLDSVSWVSALRVSTRSRTLNNSRAFSIIGATFARSCGTGTSSFFTCSGSKCCCTPPYSFRSI